MVQPAVRQRYERNPSLLAGEIEALPRSTGKPPLVVIDEVQKVPSLLDVVQDIIDRARAQFILTGSSARKLRRGNVNMLPGRLVSLRLDPFTMAEQEGSMMDRLLYGALPGIVAVGDRLDRSRDLDSYVTAYLEEEVRAEAIVRNLGPFARFLECAALESGSIINLSKLSQEVGVAHTTIASYYQILEDCLIIERIDPLTESRSRKKLTKTSRFLFFDLGVRRLAAREGDQFSREQLGKLFEQFVGLEILRLARTDSPETRLLFWRDPDGPEVDWILQRGNQLIPIETKWTEAPTAGDARHIFVFLSEYTPRAKQGFIICRTPRRVRLTTQVVALPWQDIASVLF